MALQSSRRGAAVCITFTQLYYQNCRLLKSRVSDLFPEKLEELFDSSIHCTSLTALSALILQRAFSYGNINELSLGDKLPKPNPYNSCLAHFACNEACSLSFFCFLKKLSYVDLSKTIIIVYHRTRKRTRFFNRLSVTYFQQIQTFSNVGYSNMNL